MATTKAGQAAVNKYVKNNYDRVNVTMPKGKKDLIKAHADTRDESVNGFICRAIEKQIERDIDGDTGVNIAQEAAGSPGLSLPDDVMEAARAAAQAAGETVEAFIARAVKTQSDRDKITRIL